MAQQQSSLLPGETKRHHRQADAEPPRDVVTPDAMVGGKTAVVTAEPEPASEADLRELMEAGSVPDEPSENDASEPAEAAEEPQWRDCEKRSPSNVRTLPISPLQGDGAADRAEAIPRLLAPPPFLQAETGGCLLFVPRELTERATGRVPGLIKMFRWVLARHLHEVRFARVGSSLPSRRQFGVVRI